MSSFYFKSYSGLTKIQRTEWNNRCVHKFSDESSFFFQYLLKVSIENSDVFFYFYSGISTIHAIFIAAVSVYFVFLSDLYSDHQHTGVVTFRSSALSTFALGVILFFVKSILECS